MIGDVKPVCVVGGGPAGAAVALALRKRNIFVLWLINPRARRNAVGEHLAPEGARTLDQLGLRDILCPTHHLESAGIVSYWGDEVAYERDYIYNPFGSGWNLDRRRFDDDMFALACHRGGEIVQTKALVEITRKSDIWHVTIAAPNGYLSFKFRFLVDATGRQAAVMRRLGCPPKRVDRLIGLFAQIDARSERNSFPDPRLRIEPMADGWWYSLVLKNRKLVAVYLTDADLLGPGSHAARRCWIERFAAAKATHDRAGLGWSPQSFRVVPAQTQYCPQAAGRGWLAVGDACMAFDPLAASGLAKALRDGVDAAEAIAEFLDGREPLLIKYAQTRQRAISTYLDARAFHYSQERRWQSADFWRRRNRRLHLAEANGSSRTI